MGVSLSLVSWEVSSHSSCGGHREVTRRGGGGCVDCICPIRKGLEMKDRSSGSASSPSLLTGTIIITKGDTRIRGLLYIERSRATGEGQDSMEMRSRNWNRDNLWNFEIEIYDHKFMENFALITVTPWHGSAAGDTRRYEADQWPCPDKADIREEPSG